VTTFFGRLGGVADEIGRDFHVAPICDCESTRADEAVELSATQQQEVVDEVFRRRDLAVTVVPREFDDFEQVKRVRCYSWPEQQLNSRLPRLPSICTSNCHVGLLRVCFEFSLPNPFGRERYPGFVGYPIGYPTPAEYMVASPASV
jgi:hypothetical protein